MRQKSVDYAKNAKTKYSGDEKKMDDKEKIIRIKQVFEMFHNGEDEDGFEIDAIDALMRIESIIKK